MFASFRTRCWNSFTSWNVKNRFIKQVKLRKTDKKLMEFGKSVYNVILKNDHFTCRKVSTFLIASCVAWSALCLSEFKTSSWWSFTACSSFFVSFTWLLKNMTIKKLSVNKYFLKLFVFVQYFVSWFNYWGFLWVKLVQ